MSEKTFFERYFELLDGPDPHSSLELVADDVEFSIQWAADGTRKSSQFVGGRDELRGFIDAGDTSGWAHHVLRSHVSGNRPGGRPAGIAVSESARFWPSPSSTSRVGCAGTWWRALLCWRSRLGYDRDAPVTSDRP